jgi:hypothetical protein
LQGRRGLACTAVTGGGGTLIGLAAGDRACQSFKNYKLYQIFKLKAGTG